MSSAVAASEAALQQNQAQSRLLYLFYDNESVNSSRITFQFTALFTASYRIGNDFSFDEKMAGYGCNVFSFDPTMDKEDHRHSPGVMFYNLGLSDVDQERPRHHRPWHKFDKMKWKTRTFRTIMLELGHFKVIQFLQSRFHFRIA